MATNRNTYFILDSTSSSSKTPSGFNNLVPDPQGTRLSAVLCEWVCVVTALPGSILGAPGRQGSTKRSQWLRTAQPQRWKQCCECSRGAHRCAFVHPLTHSAVCHSLPNWGCKIHKTWSLSPKGKPQGSWHWIGFIASESPSCVTRRTST